MIRLFKFQIENRLQNLSLRQILSELFSIISEKDKQIILLHCQERKTFFEIGEILGMKESAVRKRFERARKRMSAQKGEKFHEEL